MAASTARCGAATNPPAAARFAAWEHPRNNLEVAQASAARCLPGWRTLHYTTSPKSCILLTKYTIMDCWDDLAWTYVCDPGPEMGMAIAPGDAARFLLEFGFIASGEVAREADQGAAARSHLGTWCSRTDTRATAFTLRVQKPRLELKLRRLGDDVQVGIRRSYLEGFGR